MKYEIDFIGIDEETTNADAICFRFYSDSLQRYVVGVYDGGTQTYGEALTKHLNKYYFANAENPTIDFVICSHSDQDHASGLATILENFEVSNLVMNRPWLYIDEIFDKVTDGRITKQSLETRLRESYPYIDNLEKIANEKGIKIYNAFEGVEIFDKLKILSPSKEFYLNLLVESNKTPLSEQASVNIFKQIKESLLNALESWTNELLHEDVTTSAENETSVVLLGNMDEESFLLTGDAGVRALGAAIDYATSIGIDLQNVKFQQIPHHGGRHNVSPSVLDRLVGPRIDESDVPSKTAFVSVAKGSDHPKKMVVNAYIRRGAKVYEARTYTLWHHRNTPARDDFHSVDSLEFSEQVEDWED